MLKERYLCSILYVEITSRKTVRLYLQSGSKDINCTTGVLWGMVDGRFKRISRQVIVNADYVTAVDIKGRTIKLLHGKTFPASLMGALKVWAYGRAGIGRVGR